ncbi:hypothetical protein AOQ84DRAFT_415861 [Glonium stellatum]|uniref:Uncharacterized protein n=1 Tax=Glonium stellatum TaxID=574774 RepID=A0A8E2EUI0_9PEZI|nr:hypothetical protein AOQ84DRAFT_415861 [Glonium stellatum]
MSDSNVPTLLPSFINISLKAITFGLEVREEVVQEQTADLFGTIDHVCLSLNTARCLLAERANFISIQNRDYFESVLLNTQKALRAVQILVEPIRIDNQIDQKLKFKTRARWIALDKTRLAEKMSMLSIFHQSLTQVIGTLQSLRTAFTVAVDSGFGGGNMLALGNVSSVNVFAHTRAHSSAISYPSSPLLSWRRRSRMPHAEVRHDSLPTITTTMWAESVSPRAIELPTYSGFESVTETVQNVSALEPVPIRTQTPSQRVDASLDVNAMARHSEVWPDGDEISRREVSNTSSGSSGSVGNFNQPLCMSRREWLLQQARRRI